MAAGLLVAAVALFVVLGNVLETTVDDPGPVTDVAEGEAVSVAEFEAIELGMDKEEVQQALRPAVPVDSLVLERFQLRSPETVASSCVYYQTDRAAESLYRFCFEQDQLVDKTTVFPEGAPDVEGPLDAPDRGSVEAPDG